MIFRLLTPFNFLVSIIGKKITKVVAILILLIAISVGIRVFLIFLRVNPTTDEVWLYLYTKASFKEIWLSSLSEWHAPFYFIFAKAISLLSPNGLNIIFYRYLSLLFGVLANFGIWYLASMVLGKRIGLIALVLSLFLPAFIWSAIYARYYSFLILLTILNFIFFIKFLRAKSVRYLVLILLISTIGIYTHYYFSFLLVSFSLFLLIVEEYRFIFKKWILAVSAILVLLIPLIYYFVILPKPGDVWLVNHFLKIPLSVLTNLVSWELLIYLYYLGNSLFYYPLLIVLWVVSLILLFLALNGWKNNYWILFLLTSLIPPVIAIFVSYTYKPFFALGSLQIFLPPLIILLAKGIDNDLKKTKVFSLIFIVTLFFSLIFFYQSSASYQTPREDYGFLLDNYKSGDIVLHSNINSFMQSKYYLGNDVNFGIIDTVSASPQAEHALKYTIVSQDTLLAGRNRIWYFEPWFENRDELRVTKRFLDSNLRLLDEKNFSTQQKNQPSLFNVYLYVTK